MSKVFVVVPVSNANNNDNHDSILCPTKFESSDYLVLFFLPIILLSSPYSYQLLTFSCLAGAQLQMSCQVDLFIIWSLPSHSKLHAFVSREFLCLHRLWQHLDYKF